MKKCIGLLVLYLARIALWFRYRVTIKGWENLTPAHLNKKGGILFLPNHPTIFVDPTLLGAILWKKFSIRPVIVEYMYYLPVVRTVMQLMKALPIPNFSTSTNSLKKKHADQVIQTMVEQLKKKENFLIYPAGKTKLQAKEIVSASGVHQIIQEVPEANIVLIRTTGLWGSSFSRALTGKAIPMGATIFAGFKIALKNLLFFTPRREVTIEFVPNPPDFPYQASRIEMNHYLEDWYNRPDHIHPQKEKEPGESLYLVPYSMWDRNKLPEVQVPEQKELKVNLASIPTAIQEKVKAKIAEVSNRPINEIQPSLDLSTDLGLDSLDQAEIIAFLADQFDISAVPPNEITTVAKVMALAAEKVEFETELEEQTHDLTKWFAQRLRASASIPKGETIPEVFLNRCQMMQSEIACGDLNSGAISYKQLKSRVVFLAEYIRKLPGEYIGILLPSSIAAYATVLACQLAGKVPLLINWTAGSRHFESVKNLSKVEVILSSWAFLDRLDNVDLTQIETLLVMLEDVKRDSTLKDKLVAYYRSFLSTESLLTIFNVERISKHDKAVLLFTSGTENMPKGVPLSHENILSNEQGAIERVGLFQDDILLGMLPPFHAFGFTVSGLLPILAGIRVVYYPDPTNGKELARIIKKWHVTLTCGAPTFLKAIFKNAQQEQLKTLRICFTGAEKAPADLFQMVNQLENCHLIEGYGITECSPILTINLSGNSNKGVGTPLKGTDLCVVNLDSHQSVAQGEQGLVLAKGPNIFNGYLNTGVSSPFITLNGHKWYSTGDLGYIDAEGSLILSGRLKRFVKVGGEMISLSAIEDTLQKTIGAKHDHQAEGPNLAVCAKEEPGAKTRMFLFTCFSTSADEINQLLKAAGFSNLVKITKTKQMTEIPLMGSGKVNYRALESQIESEVEKTSHSSDLSTSNAL